MKGESIGREKKDQQDERATCLWRRGTVKERFKASLILDDRLVVNDEIGSDCRKWEARDYVVERERERPLLPAMTWVYSLGFIPQRIIENNYNREKDHELGALFWTD